MSSKGLTPIMTVLLVMIVVGVLSVMGGLGYLGYQKWVGPEEEKPEETEEEAPTLKTATAVIDKIKESYSGLENFVVTVESYQGKPGQSKNEMKFQNKFKFYVQPFGGKAYTQLVKEGEAVTMSTYDPLRIIGATERYKEEFEFTLQGKEKLEGQESYIIEWGQPSSKKYTVRWKVWIDAEKYTVLRQDMYSDSMLGMKSQYEYQKVNNYWLPSRIENEMHIPGEEPDKVLNIRRNYKINQEFPEQILDRLK